MEISKALFARIMKEKPADVPARTMLETIHEQGHTVAGLDIPGALSEEPSRSSQALEAFKETMGADIPYLGKAVGVLREDIPEKIAAEGLKLGLPKTGAALGAGIGTAADMLPKTGADLALQLGLSAAGKVAGPASEMAGRTGRQIYGRLAGVGDPFMKRAFERPGLVAAAKIDQDVVDSELNKAKIILKSGLDSLGAKVGKIEDSFANYLGKQSRKAKIPLEDVQKKVVDKILAMGTRIPKKLGGFGRRNRQLVDSMSPQEISQVTGILKFMRKKEGLLSWGDVLNLRRKVDSMIDWHTTGLPPLSTRGEAVLKMMRRNLNEKLYQTAPELKKANAAYSAGRGAYEQLGKKVFGSTFTPGGAGTWEAAAQQRIRLMLARGQDSSVISKKAALLGSASRKAMDEVLDSIAAKEFKPYIRKGILGGFLAAGEGIAGYEGMRPALAGGGMSAMASTPLEYAAMAAAATSPRLAGYAMKGAGTAYGAVNPVMESIARSLSQDTGLNLASRGLGQAVINKLRSP